MVQGAEWTTIKTDGKEWQQEDNLVIIQFHAALSNQFLSFASLISGYKTDPSWCPTVTQPLATQG